MRLTLLASLCWARQTEITDGLVDLLISLVHKVDVTAERKVGGGRSACQRIASMTGHACIK